jgi:hypothetical protein
MYIPFVCNRLLVDVNRVYPCHISGGTEKLGPADGSASSRPTSASCEHLH